MCAKNVFGRSVYVRSKCYYECSSHNLCVGSHAHSLEGTLIVTCIVIGHGSKTMEVNSTKNCLWGQKDVTLQRCSEHKAFAYHANEKIPKNKFQQSFLTNISSFSRPMNWNSWLNVSMTTWHIWTFLPSAVLRNRFISCFVISSRFSTAIHKMSPGI